LSGQPPFAVSNDITASSTNVLTLANGLLAVPVGKTISNTYAVAANYLNSYAQTWNLSIQDEIPFKLVAEINYTGTKGTRLDYIQLPNQAPLGSSLTSENRFPIANAGQFKYDTPSGNSSYEAAQLRLTRRMQKGVS